jgi:hypothetical protein
MLQLRNEERILVGIYPGKVGYGGGTSLSATMRLCLVEQGYELGYVAMGTSNC